VINNSVCAQISVFLSAQCAICLRQLCWIYVSFIFYRKFEQRLPVDEQNRPNHRSGENRASLMMLSGLNESRDFLEISEQHTAIKGEVEYK
jgi:hypothetical protein